MPMFYEAPTLQDKDRQATGKSGGLLPKSEQRPAIRHGSLLTDVEILPDRGAQSVLISDTHLEIAIGIDGFRAGPLG